MANKQPGGKNIKDCVDSYEDYYNVSREFLSLDVSTQVFKSTWPIFTNTNDTPPTKYLEGAKVKHSFVANGAVVAGEVSGSILGRDVEIGEGAVVKNCIIFSGSKVCAGAYLENVIIDKNAVGRFCEGERNKVKFFDIIEFFEYKTTFVTSTYFLNIVFETF